MSELILKIGTVGPDPAYQDGDILCAFNRRHIRCAHAQHICHPWKNGVTRDGLRVSDSIVENFFIHTHQYKFQRVGILEVLRTDLTALTTTLISDVPNSDGEAMDVPLFIARRMAHKAQDGGPSLAIFGVPGAETWYGGSMDFSNAKMDLVWNAIETKTREREVNYRRWPLTRNEKRFYLAVPLEEFTDDQASAYIEQVLQPSIANLVSKKRRRFVPWQDHLAVIGKTRSEIENRMLEIDVRDRPNLRNTVIEQKV